MSAANSQTAKEKLKPELFWPKVKIGLKDECWPYRGSISSWGYGTVMRTLGLGKRFTWGAHKVAWVLERGPQIRRVGDRAVGRHDFRRCCLSHAISEGMGTYCRGSAAHPRPQERRSAGRSATYEAGAWFPG